MFEWDRAKARQNEVTHRVSFADTFGVFEDPNALTLEEQYRGEERYVTIGMDSFGRVLVVVYTWRGDSIRIISDAKPRGLRLSNMKAKYDFSKARRGAVLPASGKKARITIRLDKTILDWFKAQVEKQGGGNYQSMINDALHKHIEAKDAPLEKILRKVVREELRKAS